MSIKNWIHFIAVLNGLKRNVRQMRVSSSQPEPNMMSETFQRRAKLHLISSHLADRLKKSVGFRNLAVRNYPDLNCDIVFTVA